MTEYCSEVDTKRVIASSRYPMLCFCVITSGFSTEFKVFASYSCRSGVIEIIITSYSYRSDLIRIVITSSNVELQYVSPAGEHTDKKKVRWPDKAWMRHLCFKF